MPHADADIEIDFRADWLATLRAALKACGFDPPIDDRAAQIAYFNFLKRRIPAWPRIVQEASTLVCPAAVRAGYDEVKRKAATGEDLRPHLSRKLASRDYNDLLLNDWGIHHLHLGTVIEEDGFVERTGAVLFARFLKDNAYFIAVPEHGAWTDVQILERLADEWPSELDFYELRGVSPSSNPTSDELRRGRKAGVQALLTIRGRVIVSLGGGITTSTVSLEVVRVMDLYLDRVLAFEHWVAQSKDEIFAKAVEHGVTLARPVRFRMVVRQDGSVFARTEDEPGFGFPLGQIT